MLFLYSQVDETKKNHICSGCNNNLVLFHMLKRDVKKYPSFANHIALMDILHKLEEFLEQNDNLKSLTITEDSTKWSIQFAISHSLPKESLSKEEFIVYDPEVIEEEIDEETIIKDDISEVPNVIIQSCLEIEEKPQLSNEVWECHECGNTFGSIEALKSHLDTFHSCDNKNTYNDDEDIQMLEEGEEECSEMDIYESKIEDFPKAKRRKLNTLEDLKTDQIEWIKQQASQSVILKGKKKSYKCSLCEVILSTQASLVRHLRDIHLLKDPTNEKSILKEEVIKSQIAMDTKNGTETFWKCSQCARDRIYKSEQAFKLHFRMNHIRDIKIDSSFISTCRTTISENKSVKDVWKCPECTKIFRHRDGLRNHLKISHMKKIDELQNESVELNKDIIIASTETFHDKINDENYCNECGVKFLATKHHVKPRIHRECHEMFKNLAPSMPHYKCDGCKIVFSTENSLQQHLQIHDNPEKIQIIKAEGLASFGAAFSRNAIGDVDEACLDEAVWNCGHCSAKYYEENDCVAHQLLLHSSSIKCFIDNRKFEGLTGLSKYLQHMRNKHPELFPNISFPCSSCKLDFPSIYEKLAHQKLCNLKKYECDYCSKRYSTKHQLQAHMLFELGITGFSCETCNKRCKTMSDLRIHNNIHTGLRPYSCSLCDKSFKTPAARSSHMEKHTNEEGIICEICNAKLTNRTLYQRHKRFQHDQEFRDSQYEKNSCNICGKSFLRNSHYKQHLKQHGIDKI